MVLPALIAAGGIAARVVPWVLTMAPLIAEFFSGKGGDEQAAQKIGEARDGLAARLAAAEGISIAKATDIVNQHLQPLIDQHAQDAGSKGSGLAAGALSAAGGIMVGRQMGGLGKLAKAAAAEAPAAEASVASALSPAKQSALASVRDVGRLDSAVMASKKQGLPVISGKQEQALGGLVDDNRLARLAKGNDVGLGVPTSGQAGAASDIGMRGRFASEAPDFEPGLDQAAAVNDIGGTQRYRNELDAEAPGMSEMDDLVNRFRTQEAIRRLLETNGFKGFRTPSG